MNRTFNVARMQLVNKQTFVWVPALVLGGALVINLAVYAILRSSGVPDDTPMYGGGAQAPLWYFAVIGAQALTFTFPFSQAMSVSRREFFAGTLLVALATSAAMAIVFVLGGLIEDATGGWGMNGYFFRLDWLWAAGPLVAGLFYLGLSMLFFLVGFAGATVYKRFGTAVLTIVSLGIVALGVAAMWLIGSLDAWEVVFTRIADAGPTGLTAGVIALSALLAAVSFPVLRRATP
ncbi:hypothetical protein [Microbacterium thalli]|uniref:ABC transporter permease n=1 Tax=Microbacterium thalli TaxID=3027921 RepID=A0ABT5SDS1_9MICO|nr:hypothetical protein [Microbacterium thalli]MDD7960956.1 hypothetical protein [Microbacterium thalli]MDN8549785.1 hypothetical protein [Microbacterium thalli]